MLEGKDLNHFSITSWYKDFEHIALKTIIIALPSEIVTLIATLQYDVIELIKQTSFDHFESETESAINTFRNEIENALNSFDNKIFVKNNWHAPTDAKMFSMNNLLIATNIDDILQYVIVSCKVMNDFSIKGIPFCLALKPWINIHPASEFRCIIINKVLRGITPRDWPTYYAHFKEEGPDIINLITNFFNENIKNNTFPRDSYTFDIILQYPSKKILLLDFGPLNTKSNLYAFSTREVLRLMAKDTSDEIAPVFRYLDSDIGIMTRSTALQKFKIH